VARNHGRILTSIWADQEFRDRSPEAQRLYMFLLSQPGLNHAGLLALTLRRWAGAAAGLTVDGVRQALDELAATRFVVVDDDTEEVLVRTLVRNDQVYKQPKVMLAMEGDAREIASPKLQAALVAEFDRLDLSTLSDVPPKSGGESTRAIVTGVVNRLRQQFAKATAKASERVSGRVSDTPGEPLAIPIAEGIGYPHARAGAPSPTPSPTPTPAVPPAAAEPPARRETPNQRANRLTKTYTERVKPSNHPAISKIVRKAVDANCTDELITKGLNELADEGRSVTTDTLRIAMYGKPRASPGPSRNGQILDGAMERAVAAEQRMQSAQSPKGEITS
jgi:hypothetical protein